MKSNLSKKKQDLLERLIDAAEAEVAQRGLRSLKARDIATKAGCALGALYTVVEDLDDLITHVNSRTLRRMGVSLRAAVPEGGRPVDALRALAAAYVSFALGHTRLWAAIFYQQLPEGREFPEWHKADYPVLIEQIIAPLSELLPELEEEALTIRARTLYAAVHGVVSMSIHGRYVGVPKEMLHAEVDALLDALTRGLEGPAPQTPRSL